MEAVIRFQSLGLGIMDYLKQMGRILRLDGTGLAEPAGSGRIMRYCMVNVTLLGLIYGIASIHFAGLMLARQSGAAVSFNPLMLLMVGVSMAFILHGGLALFVWVFCRALGGGSHFLPVYMHLGAAAVALWPLALLAPALQAGVAGTACATAAGAAVIYGASVLFVAVKVASGFSWMRMTLAAAATLIYVACFLYLWM